MKTVCAISTPLAVGGISVIRISGDKAIEIASKIFQPLSCESVESMSGYTCCFGRIVSNGEIIDEGILTIFRSPKSYTGEDVVEISCHGGIYVTKRVLRAAVESGAEPAAAGEFSKRAFLNGKLSLTQAEAVMDLISAQGEQTRRSALSVREGALFSQIREITTRLVHILGELAAWVDYPEEDLPDIQPDILREDITNCIEILQRLSNGYDKGRLFREGIDTVITGKPNVGKSTLMNLLLGFERSIVTDIAGTTRDVVEESVRIGDVILRLSDTAGIRQTDDTVEAVGVKLAYKRLEEAMLIIAVFDNSAVLSDEDKEIIHRVKNRHCIAVINKSDLEQKLETDEISNSFERVVEICAKNAEGLIKLEQAVSDIFRLNDIDAFTGIISNERQKSCVSKSLSSLTAALEALVAGETYDAVTVMIDEAANSLLELSGEKATEAVVSEVFSKFCVGK